MKETLNSLQRCRAVIEGKIPDRIPVCLLNFQNAAHYMGYSVGECVLDSQKASQAQIAFWEEFRHDMIEIENGICVLAEAAGCEIEYVEDALPWVSKPVLGSLEEIDKLRQVDLENSPCARALINTIRIISERLGTEVCIRGDSDQAPFSLASELLGLENFFVALMDPSQHEKIHRLLAYATEQVKRLVRAVISAGSHYTILGDSTAGPDVCSPRIYRQFAQPYETKVIMDCYQSGIEVGTHICGNATKIIEDMIATQAKYFELDYKIDRVAVNEAVKDKATIIGTVDPSNIISLGTPQEVYEKAKEDIQIFGPNGRFILGAGCSIPTNTPNANITALIKAAHNYGWYDSEGQLTAFPNRSNELG